MSTPSGKLMVMAGNEFACVKITGRATFTLSIDFQTLLDLLLSTGRTYVVMDLSECLLMDSTFLGTLTGFGLKMNKANGSSEHVVELLNPNARIQELLDNMGVLQLFRVKHGTLASPEALEDCTPKATRPNQEQLTRKCLEAHNTLMSLNDENAARFKDVAQYLGEELKKHKAGG